MEAIVIREALEAALWSCAEGQKTLMVVDSGVVTACEDLQTVLSAADVARVKRTVDGIHEALCRLHYELDYLADQVQILLNKDCG
jgi:hypothetical protein